MPNDTILVESLRAAPARPRPFAVRGECGGPVPSLACFGGFQRIARARQGGLFLGARQVPCSAAAASRTWMPGTRPV